MTSSKPYLLRGLYEWILDNQMIPHIVVNAAITGVKVPMQYVRDGQIVLNISPEAAQHLQMDNECVVFNARFGGEPMRVYVPMQAVLAIYTRETGAGMVFNADEEDTTTGGSSSGDTSPTKPGKPHLTIVK